MIYNLKISRYEGHIINTIKKINPYNINPKYLSKYSCLRETFPMIYIRNKNYHNNNNSKYVEQSETELNKRSALKKREVYFNQEIEEG